MSPPKEMTTDYCRSLVTCIEECFSNHQVPIASNSHMRFFLNEISWLASHEDIFVDAVGKNQDRALRAFLRAFEAVHVEKALAESSGIPGVRGTLKYLAKRRMSETGTMITGKGWELLYELEIAGKLRNTEWELSFREPDIVATIPELDHTLAFACKRPRKLNALSGCLKKAVNQLSGSRQVGLIVVGLDGLLRHAIKRSDTPESFKEEAGREMDAAIETAHGQTAHTLDKWSAGGLFFTCRFIATLRKPSCYYYLNLVRNIPAVDKDPTGTINALVSQLLREEYTTTETPREHQRL